MHRQLVIAADKFYDKARYQYSPIVQGERKRFGNCKSVFIHSHSFKTTRPDFRFPTEQNYNPSIVSGSAIVSREARRPVAAITRSSERCDVTTSAQAEQCRSRACRLSTLLASARPEVVYRPIADCITSLLVVCSCQLSERMSLTLPLTPQKIFWRTNDLFSEFNQICWGTINIED